MLRVLALSAALVATSADKCSECGEATVCWREGVGVSLREAGIVVAELPEPMVATARGFAAVQSKDGNFAVKPVLTPAEGVTDWAFAEPAEDRSCFALRGSTSTGTVTLEAVRGLNGSIRFDAVLDAAAGAADSEVVALDVHIARDDVPVFGMGIQYTVVDLRGRRVPVLTTEQGVGRGIQPSTFLLDLLASDAGGSWHRTYAPAPHYLTASAQQAWLDNYEVSEFDFTPRDRTVARVLFASSDARPAVRLHARREASPLRAVEAFTAATGRMRAPPDWVHRGAILGVQGGTDAVRAAWRNVTAAGAPVAGLWMQDWCGKRVDAFGTRLWWNWRLDEERYPGWDELVNELEAAGARPMLYVNPYLANTGRTGLFDEARRRGFLLRDPRTGEPYVQSSGSAEFTFGTVDLARAEARAWYRDQLLYMLRTVRAGGWMADFGEYTPLDAVSSGALPREGPLPGGAGGAPAASTGGPLGANALHNRFPELWALTNEEAVEEFCAEGGCARGGRPVHFMRAGALRSPARTAVQWMGDQLVTFDRFDGLASAAVGQLSAGLQGFAATHSDAGGYTMLDKAAGLVRYVRGEELLVRWLEHSAFADVMLRTHLGNLGDSSVQVFSNAAMLRAFARWARVHAALFPQRKRALSGAQQRHGTPWVRHPWLHWPCDAAAARLMPWAGETVANSWTGTQGDGRFNLSSLPPYVLGDDGGRSPPGAGAGVGVGAGEQVQFMAGPALMVAPVTAHASASVTLYLPRGRWAHAWSGAVVDAAAACVEEERGESGACRAAPRGGSGPRVTAVRRASGDAGETGAAALAPVCGGSAAPSGAWVDVYAPIGSPAVFCLLAAAEDAKYDSFDQLPSGEGRKVCAQIVAAAASVPPAPQQPSRAL